MDSELTRRKVVVPSYAAAVREITEWLKVNNYRILQDLSGLPWYLDVVTHQQVDPHGTLRWRVEIRLSAKATVRELLETGTLNVEVPDDQRLAKLIGASRIPFAMKPKELVFDTAATVRQGLTELIPQFKKVLQDPSIVALKRRLIHRWVNRSRIFDHSAFENP